MDSIRSIAGEVGIVVLTALVLLGAIPMFVMVCQCFLAAFHHRRDHYDKVFDRFDVPDDPGQRRADGREFVSLPRVAVLIPAWNEVAVLRYSIDEMMRLDYPADALRVVVVDDASTDDTPELMAEKMALYPDRLLHLRREKGGEGKAHTLNHGLRELLRDDWADAVLITDADVVFEPTSIRRMVRHLDDPEVGAVTAYIREASAKPSILNRYIGYEYTTAQAFARRAHNMMGAQACLAGGAQLHTRENLLMIGGQIDSTTLAEDTVTTFLTQLAGKRVVFDGNAECLAEEPTAIGALWKQRLRWARGNLQVTRRFGDVFFRRSDDHHLGGTLFGLAWFGILLLPVLTVVASAALVVLWSTSFHQAAKAFSMLWLFNGMGFVLATLFVLQLDGRMARRAWFQAITFPGLVSLAAIMWAIAPGPTHAFARTIAIQVGIGWSDQTQARLALAVYCWGAICIPAAWLVYRLDRIRLLRPLARVGLLVVGFGPLLCAVTVAAYSAEARGASAVWDKTEKTGRLVAAQ